MLTDSADGYELRSAAVAAKRDAGGGRRYRRWIWIMVALGLVLRGVYLAVTWNWTPLVDNAFYVQRAVWLWEHGSLMPSIATHTVGKVVKTVTVPDTWWPPVFSIFLTLQIGLHQLLHTVGLVGALPSAGNPGPIHGNNPLALYQFLRVTMSCFGVLVVPFSAALARRLLGRPAAYITAATSACYPPLIYVGASLYSESLFLILALAALLCVIEFSDRARWRWLVLSGILAGLAMLCHADGAIIVVPLMLGAWLSAKRRPLQVRTLWRAALRPFVVVASAVLVMIPWIIHNEVRLHAFIPLGTSLGPTLASTYSAVAAADTARPGSWILLSVAHPVLNADYWIPSPKTSAEFEHIALQYIRQHPAYVLKVGYWNTRRMFELNGPQGPDGSETTAYWEGIPHGLTWAGDFCVWIVCLLAICGLFTKTLRRSAHRWVWSTPVLLWLAVIFVSVETPRFRSPIDPFLLIAASAVPAAWWGRARPRREDEAVSDTVVAAVGGPTNVSVG